MKKFLLAAALFCFLTPVKGQNIITLYPDSAKEQISRHIYGHFAEHLGRCIYEGIWVGPDSPIPNTRGIRNDVVKALRDIKVPNVRWPGGCFADTYHWMDGVGDPSQRKKIVNTNWGGVTEDNSFGTHEFMDLCEQLECEPVICGNIGSGTVQEMADWVEYLTSDAESPMTELRKKNGREKPWKVKYFGIGNETWGCGGNMTVEFYSNELRKYSNFVKNYGDNVLYKIASGSNDKDYPWTEHLVDQWANKTQGYLKGYMSGISLHYYTICNNWDIKGSATDFSKEEWGNTFFKTKMMDEFVKGHSDVLDKYDPENKIGLIIDEWGNWFEVEPGTNPGFLYQQNTLRDALVASINLDIFNNNCTRVKMANIAQMINVLQSVILTKKEKLVLTPTYYVFKMFTVHHDATLIPSVVKSDNFVIGDNTIPSISGSASVDKDGKVHITVTNADPDMSKEVKIELDGEKSYKFVRGEIITGKELNSLNDFDKSEEVNIKEFKNVKVNGKNIEIKMPSKSVVMIELK